MDKAGVRLVCVGVGPPESATKFCDSLGFPKDNMYCDPDRNLYKQLSLKAGVGRTLFSPKTFTSIIKRGMETFKEAMKNYDRSLLKPPQQDMAWQQGGLFVFDDSKRVVYSHQDQATADHAPMPEVMKACCDK